MAGLSTWKQPIVRASWRRRKVAGSRSGIRLRRRAFMVAEIAASPRTERRSSLISFKASTASRSK